jgi:hypothetical protein
MSTFQNGSRSLINRRHFLKGALTLPAGMSLGALKLLSEEAAPSGLTTQSEPEGFFTLGQRKGHWFLITPDGQPFFTMGLNHIDPASLRYPENLEIWKDKYDGSTIKWIEDSVAPNLQSWGFNSVGWVQEVTVKKWQHSRPLVLSIA